MRNVAEILGRQVTTADMAAVLGMSPYSVRQMRLEESASGYRRPPAGWEAKLARLARRRSAELVKLAERLEQET